MYKDYIGVPLNIGDRVAFLPDGVCSLTRKVIGKVMGFTPKRVQIGITEELGFVNKISKSSSLLISLEPSYKAHPEVLL